MLEGRLADAPLGATISIQIPVIQVPAGLSGPPVRVPIGAIFDRGSGPGVWLIEGDTPRVTWRSVQLSRTQRRSGFGRRKSRAGDRVVALGAHLLQEGEQVRLPGSEATAGERVREPCGAAVSGFNLSALAVRERSVTLFLLVAISIAGVVAFLMLGRAEDPSFTIKQMTVVTAWPGATAKQMEELVAERLEKRMQELRWYDRTETFTRPGLALHHGGPARQHAARRCSRGVLSGAEETRRRGRQPAAWRHRSVGERRIFRCDLRALRVEGERGASSARLVRDAGGLASTTAARARRQESEHHRRAGGKDLRRVLLRPARNAGRVPAETLRRAQQPERHDAGGLDRSARGRRSSSGWTARSTIWRRSGIPRSPRKAAR